MPQPSITLSICIPTNGRIEITRRTIQSIYKDADKSALDEFEVVISDNSKDGSSSCFEKEFPFENFRYYRSNSSGYMNSVDSLRKGRGEFLKLHNNYMLFRSGTLAKTISDVQHLRVDKPSLFYSNGFAFHGGARDFPGFDSFLYHLSYLSSWSAGFGIWREDLGRITDARIDMMFPHTSLLLAQNDKSRYVLDDTPVFEGQQVHGKGGYDIFKVFGIDYLNLIHEQLEAERITPATWRQIKHDLLYKYLASRYFKTVITKRDNFDHVQSRDSLSMYYSGMEYRMMTFASLFAPIQYTMRKAFICYAQRRKAHQPS